MHVSAYFSTRCRIDIETMRRCFTQINMNFTYTLVISIHFVLVYSEFGNIMNPVQTGTDCMNRRIAVRHCVYCWQSYGHIIVIVNSFISTTVGYGCSLRRKFKPQPATLSQCGLEIPHVYKSCEPSATCRLISISIPAKLKLHVNNEA